VAESLGQRINKYLGFTPKDWFTTGFSVLALAISAITAYFSVLRREDNLSVVIGNIPVVHRLDGNTIGVTNSETTLVFLNSGTRPAAIASVRMFFLQHEGPSKCDRTSTGQDGPWFSTTFEPLSVKGNEVATQNIAIKHPFGSADVQKNDKGFYVFPVSDENKKKEVLHIELCYSFLISTPSVATIGRNISGLEYRLEIGRMSYDAIDQTKPPAMLIKKSGTIFGD
jgi:hypothetical protein